MQTLLLDVLRWDLVVDANGNIALASEPYSLAQDAASALRLFQGELWYDTSQGIPYFQVPHEQSQTNPGSVLGQMPPLALLKQYFSDAAASVPDVDSAQAFVAAINPLDRSIIGQVQTFSTAGKFAAAKFFLVPQPIITAQPVQPEVLGEFVLGGATLA